MKLEDLDEESKRKLKEELIKDIEKEEKAKKEKEELRESIKQDVKNIVDEADKRQEFRHNSVFDSIEQYQGFIAVLMFAISAVAVVFSCCAGNIGLTIALVVLALLQIPYGILGSKMNGVLYIIVSVIDSLVVLALMLGLAYVIHLGMM